MKKLALALLCVMAAAAPRRARAQITAGASSFEFLQLDANARAVALGGAYTALANDSNALLYNPAGLGLVRSYEATFMHNRHIQGLNQEYVGLATKQGLGASINYLNFNDIPRTTLSEHGGTGSNFGISDIALGAGYGRVVYNTLSLGLAAKHVRETIDGIQAAGYAFDAGALYPVPSVPGLTFGVAALNIGPSVKFMKRPERLPLVIRGGVAYVFPLLNTVNTLAFDLRKNPVDKAHVGIGAETVVAKMFALRLGVNSSNDSDIGLTAGMGMLIDRMSLDYAIVPMGNLGISHRISMTFRWGSVEEEVPRSKPRPRRKASEPSPTPVSLFGPEDHMALAQNLMESGAYAQARQELTKAAELMGPQDRLQILYYERLGAIALREEDLEKAKGLYMEGIKLAAVLGLSDPSVADAYAGMGQCLVAQKNHPYAAKFFRKALEVGPSAKTRQLIQSQLKNIRQ